MYFHVYCNLQIHAHIYRSFIRHHKMLGVRIAKRKIEPQKPANPCSTKLCARIFFVNTLQKASKAWLSVLFCCQNTETVILPAFDRQRRCCSLLRYFLRWKVFDELLHGGCRVGLLLHSKADWVVIGLLQERISILYGMRCKIRPGRMLTPRPLSTIAVMAKSSQAVK